jgi:hypothetical protein
MPQIEVKRNSPAWIDPAEIGRETAPIEFPLERGKIAEFAAAIKDDNALFSDFTAARTQGFEDIPIPLTYPTVVRHFQTPAAQIKYPFPNERLLHGGFEVVYHRHPVAGEKLYCSQCIADAYEKEGKKGGTMKFIIVEQRFRDGAGKMVITVRNTVLGTAETL